MAQQSTPQNRLGGPPPIAGLPAGPSLFQRASERSRKASGVRLSAPGRDLRIDGMRVLLLDEDRGRADEFRVRLRDAGAKVVAAWDERTFDVSRSFDPMVVVTSRRMRRDFVPSLRADARLRWARVLDADIESFEAHRAAAAPTARLLTRLATTEPADLDLADRLRAVDGVETQLLSLGPCRLMRAVASVDELLRITAQTPTGDMQIEIEGELIVSCSLYSSMRELEGLDALSVWVRLGQAQVAIEVIAHPARINLMMPLDQALIAAAAALDGELVPARTWPPAPAEGQSDTRVRVPEVANDRAVREARASDATVPIATQGGSLPMNPAAMPPPPPLAAARELIAPVVSAASPAHELPRTAKPVPLPPRLAKAGRGHGTERTDLTGPVLTRVPPPTSEQRRGEPAVEEPKPLPVSGSGAFDRLDDSDAGPHCRLEVPARRAPRFQVDDRFEPDSGRADRHGAAADRSRGEPPPFPTRRRTAKAEGASPVASQSGSATGSSAGRGPAPRAGREEAVPLVDRAQGRPTQYMRVKAPSAPAAIPESTNGVRAPRLAGGAEQLFDAAERRALPGEAEMLRTATVIPETTSRDRIRGIVLGGLLIVIAAEIATLVQIWSH